MGVVGKEEEDGRRGEGDGREPDREGGGRCEKTKAGERIRLRGSADGVFFYVVGAIGSVGVRLGLFLLVSIFLKYRHL